MKDKQSQISPHHFPISLLESSSEESLDERNCKHCTLLNKGKNRQETCAACEHSQNVFEVDSSGSEEEGDGEGRNSRIIAGNSSLSGRDPIENGNCIGYQEMGEMGNELKIAKRVGLDNDVQIEELVSKLNDSIKEKEDLINLLESEKIAGSAKENRILEISSKLEAAKHENEELGKELEAEKKACAEKELFINELFLKLEAAKHEVEQCSSNNSTLSQMISDRNKQIEDLGQKLYAEKSVCAEKELRIQELSSKFEFETSSLEGHSPIRNGEECSRTGSPKRRLQDATSHESSKRGKGFQIVELQAPKPTLPCTSQSKIAAEKREASCLLS